MGRIPRTSAGDTQRDEWRLRELSRRATTTSGTGTDDTAAIARLPGGLLAAPLRRTTNVTGIGTGWVAVLSGLAVAVRAGRRYQVSARLGAWVDSTPWSILAAGIFYTLDGSAPTSSSTQLTEAGIYCPDSGYATNGGLDEYLTAAADATLTVSLYAKGLASGRTFGVYGLPPRPCWLAVDDRGAP